MDHSSQLGSERIGRLLVRMSAPAMVGLIVQAFYNLTDTIFVGRGVGSLAIAGIAISFPVQILVMAIAQTFGIGGASIVSRNLGAGEPEPARRTLGNLFSIIVLASAVIAVFGSLYLDPLLRLFGATDTILPYGQDYLRIILLGTPFFMFAMATNAVVRGEGNARVAMGTMIIAGLLNIVLDPLFIYGFDMGVRGAALATVLAQATTVVYLVHYFVAGRSSLRTRLSDLRLDAGIVWESFAIGIGSGLRAAAGSFTTIILNNALAVYGGDTAIAAFGVINRIIMFLFLPMFGVVQGMMPIVGFNYGARRLDRARQAIRLSTVVTTVMSFGTTAILIGFPGLLMRIFTNDEALITMAIPAIRVVVIAFPTVGFQVIAAGMYQALGRPLPAMILALLRQVILLTPLILVLPRFLNLSGVWTSFPIADGLAAIVTASMLVPALRGLRDRRGDAESEIAADSAGR
jgi:putative MATE family efflux protein